MIKILPYIVAGMATGAVGVSTRDMLATVIAFGLARIVSEIMEGKI